MAGNRLPSLREQLDLLKKTLRETQLGPQSSYLPYCIDVLLGWAGTISDGEWVELDQLIAKCFQITVEDVRRLRTDVPVPEKPRTAIEDLLPTSGWLSSYLSETIQSESPTIFHFMCAANALGAMCDRRMWASKGHYRVYTNINMLLIAPTGKCRKTSAINIMEKVLLMAGYEKFILGVATPEAFIMDIGVNDPASCVIIGREMSAFFRKAKYLEGMIPIFTDLSDCPDNWRSLTIGRGKLVLKNVMISSAFGSTMDWLNRNMPVDIFGGGFFRRFFSVYQERTTRMSPIPADMEPGFRRLADELKKVSDGFGEFELAGEPARWYIDWYTKMKNADLKGGDERLEHYLESKPDHLLRMAMILRVSESQRSLSVESLQQALTILDWMEQFLPKVFSQFAGSEIGQMGEKVLRYLASNGGRMAHSDIVRRMSKYMSAGKLMEIINTLKEGDMIEERPKRTDEQRSYYLTKKARQEAV